MSEMAERNSLKLKLSSIGEVFLFFLSLDESCSIVTAVRI